MINKELKIGRRNGDIVDVRSPYPAIVSVPAAGSAIVAEIKNPPQSLRPILKKVGNALADTTGAPFISWSLLVNGARWSKLESFTNQISDPARPLDFLPYEDVLPTGSSIQLVATNSDTTNAHLVVGNITVYYESFDL